MEDTKEGRESEKVVRSTTEDCQGWVLVGISCKDWSGHLRGYACNQDYGGGIFFEYDKIRDMTLGVSG